MSALRFTGFALVLSMGVSACSGGSQGTVPPAQGVQQPTNFTSGNFYYDTTTLKKASSLGPVSFGGFGLDVSLKMRNPDGLRSYAAAVSDPDSASYRHFITAADIGNQYGASPSDEAAAIKYFQGYGLKVNSWPQHMMLHVGGTQSQLQAAFHTQFGKFSLNGKTFIAPVTPPSVPGTLAVTGSPNIVARADRFQRALILSQGAGQTIGYSPQQVAGGFDYTGAYGAGYTGSGITIGIIGTGPVAVQGVNGITRGDVDAMRTLFGVGGSSHITLPPVTNAAGTAAGSNSGFTTPPTVTASTNTCNSGTPNPVSGYGASESPFAGCNPEDGEAQIDTEQAALLARDATVEFYLAYNPNDFCSGVPAGSACAPGAGISAQGLLETDAETQQAIADNTADVLSLSFGESEQDITGQTAYINFETAQYAALASEGIATFVSSGDQGAEGCAATGPASMYNNLCPEYPASDVSNVAVGGVTIPLNGAGALIGPLAAWGVQTSAGNSGSGGGLSTLFGVPKFQTNVAYYNATGTAIALTKRGLPDVSLLGDPNTGVALVTDADPSLGGYNVSAGSAGGTSVAAPQMAAMWALVLQACKAKSSCAKASGGHPYRLGNPNALFYKLYGLGKAASYPATFVDVTYGNNSLACTPTMSQTCPSPSPSLDTGYSAGTGYDLVTGIGAPFARALIKSVVGV